MSFYLPVGVREYFKPIDDARGIVPKFDSMFDKYYLCLIVGLDARKLGDALALEDAEFIRSYTNDYHPQAEVIAGLLVDAELERKGIKPEDRSSIEAEVLRLLDPASANRVSDEGADLLNLYAAAGFGIVRDKILRPNSLEEFLLAYQALWDSST